MSRLYMPAFLCFYKSLVGSHGDYGDLNWFPALKKDMTSGKCPKKSY